MGSGTRKGAWRISVRVRAHHAPRLMRTACLAWRITETVVSYVVQGRMQERDVDVLFLVLLAEALILGLEAVFRTPQRLRLVRGTDDGSPPVGIPAALDRARCRRLLKSATSWVYSAPRSPAASRRNRALSTDNSWRLLPSVRSQGPPPLLYPQQVVGDDPGRGHRRAQTSASRLLSPVGAVSGVARRVVSRPPAAAAASPEAVAGPEIRPAGPRGKPARRIGSKFAELPR